MLLSLHDLFKCKKKNSLQIKKITFLPVATEMYVTACLLHVMTYIGWDEEEEDGLEGTSQVER